MACRNRIHVRNPYGTNGYTYYPVLIIGAGASGIAMGCRLKDKLGFDQFRIFDRQSGLGGTWWINRYPGVACDIPTALYSFSFAPNYTARQIYPSGQDYVEYLYRVAERYRIIDKVQLNVDVTELRYIEEDQEWEVHLSYLLPGMGDISARERHEQASVCVKREIVRAQVVVSCVGILVEPTAWPTEIPGPGVFEGDIIHSARWPQEGNLEGKDVVVIGSGCSAAQLVPSLLQTKVKSVTQVMRTPPWVSPRIDEPFGKEAYARYAPTIFRLFPVLGYAFRAIIRLYTELLWLTVFQKSHVKLRGKVEETSLAHMRSKVPEKYHKIMTPRYSYGCKRRVFDSAWLNGMNSSRFRLVMEPLNRLEARTVILGGKDARTSESTRPAEEIRVAADVIVLATGFAASQFLHPLQVHGRHGVALHDLWDERGGVQAYMGTAIDGFPNFFMTVGPNTFVGHTSVMLGIENTVAYILNMIGCVLNGDARTVEPTREAALHWAAEIQRELPHTVFTACDSWYRDGKGWNSTMYPRSQIDFALRCAFPRHRDWAIAYTRQGVVKRTIWRLGYVAAAVTLIALLLRGLIKYTLN